MKPITLFIDINGRRLASDTTLLPISLYKGMKITIHGCYNEFRVVDWNYHHGHPDEDAGLRIILEEV